MDKLHVPHAYDPGALKATISKFYRPSGASTQLRGVASDIVLPSTTDFSKMSESAMKNPLPWDTIPSTPYRRLNQVEPYLAELRARSTERVANDVDFEDLVSDIERLKEMLAKKAVSLNEVERRREIAETKRVSQSATPSIEGLTRIVRSLMQLQSRTRASPGLPPVDSDPSTMSKSPTNDVDLDESERVLADYIALVHRD